jgi:GTP-binding protein
MANKRNDPVVSALGETEWPPESGPEVAVLGRSNAGKSSVLNALVGRPMAHVSSTPGRTQRINFYAMNGWYLVDLPGYGYAKVPRSVKAAFSEAVDRYLQTRQALVAAILVQDVRRDVEAEEDAIRAWAAARNVMLIVVANKSDKLSPRERSLRQEVLSAAYGQPVYLVSARNKTGLDAVRAALRGLGLAL